MVLSSTVVGLYLAWTHSKGKLVKLEKKNFNVILIVCHFKATSYLGKFLKKYEELSIKDIEIFDKVQIFFRKIFRSCIFYDPQGGHIIQYRNLRHPSPPKKVRRLLWTPTRIANKTNVKDALRTSPQSRRNEYVDNWRDPL